MSTEHRKPVVAFVMLALAAVLVVGLQQADARGERMLAAGTAPSHVQGAIASPTQESRVRDDDRFAGLASAFVSVRDLSGHAGTRAVNAAAQPGSREVRSAPTQPPVVAAGTSALRSRQHDAGRHVAGTAAAESRLPGSANRGNRGRASRRSATATGSRAEEAPGQARPGGRAGYRSSTRP